MASVRFHSEHPDHTFDKNEEVSEWIHAVCRTENMKIEQLDFIFCTDDSLLEINIKYLNHNNLTDIITFPYSEGKLIESDVFISVDRVRENAEKFGVTRFDELCRVIIHGVLHLCGYGDKTPEEAELMRKKEDYCLSLRSF